MSLLRSSCRILSWLLRAGNVRMGPPRLSLPPEKQAFGAQLRRKPERTGPRMPLEVHRRHPTTRATLHLHQLHGQEGACKQQGSLFGGTHGWATLSPPGTLQNKSEWKPSEKASSLSMCPLWLQFYVWRTFPCIWVSFPLNHGLLTPYQALLSSATLRPPSCPRILSSLFAINQIGF